MRSNRVPSSLFKDRYLLKNSFGSSQSVPIPGRNGTIYTLKNQIPNSMNDPFSSSFGQKGSKDSGCFAASFNRHGKE